MLKNILDLNGVQKLNKSEQITVKGGEQEPCFRVRIGNVWVCV